MDRVKSELSPSEPLFPDRGANFRTHKLKRTSPNELRFQPTWLCHLFIMVLFAISLFMLVAGVGLFISQSGLGGLAMFAGGCLFLGVGAWLRIVVFGPRICDLRSQELTVPAGGFRFSKEVHRIRFSDIDHLELVGKLIRGLEVADYHSYELNVVQKNCRRVGITDHADLGSALEDANLLAGQIGSECKVVVWNR